MPLKILMFVAGAAGLAFLLRKASIRLRLSRAKHRSLSGHSKIAQAFRRLGAVLRIR